jgi:hypothetical protein
MVATMKACGAVLVLSLIAAGGWAAPWPFDMRVERVDTVGDTVRVTTTGAGFEFLTASGEVRLIQRIGGRRPLGPFCVYHDDLVGLRVTTQDERQVTLQADGGLKLQVTCDSVLKVTPPDRKLVELYADFRPDWVRSTKEGTLALDERGGVGMYPLFAAEERPAGVYSFQMWVPPGESVAVCVCPPREYDWKQHHSERIVHQFPELVAKVPGDSPRPLPTDDELRTWRSMGNVLVLHLEFWDGFGIQHIRPRDPERFRQVVTLAHELGYLVVPYSSTYYYTPAVAPDGKLRDDAVDLYLDEAKWLLDTYEVDGLYWDGVFPDVGRAWECAWRMREILGSRRLYVHATTLPLWDPDLPVPFVDAWADYTLRGEGLGRDHVDPIYLRYVASGYNISNAIGELCYETCRVAPDMMQWALEANVRLPYWPGQQVYGVKEYFLSAEEDVRFRRDYVPAADSVTGEAVFARLAAGGQARREARREEKAKALAAGEAALGQYLQDQRAKVGESGNLAAFSALSWSEYCDRPEGLHGIGYRPEYATDGNLETYWAADHPPVSLVIGLGKLATISRIRVTNYFGDPRYYHYRVEVSANASEWTPVVEKTNDNLATADGDLHEFPPVRAAYVRVVMLHNSSNWGQHVAEVEVYP